MYQLAWLHGICLYCETDHNHCFERPCNIYWLECLYLSWVWWQRYHIVEKILQISDHRYPTEWYTYLRSHSNDGKPGAVARSEACLLGMQAAPMFDPHARHILSWRLDHENTTTAILPLPLIQEEQLSVTG